VVGRRGVQEGEAAAQSTRSLPGMA
jgi:hypothetical protein